jgi:AraC-like DNA-binding protein
MKIETLDSAIRKFCTGVRPYASDEQLLIPQNIGFGAARYIYIHEGLQGMQINAALRKQYAFENLTVPENKLLICLSYEMILKSNVDENSPASLLYLNISNATLWFCKQTNDVLHSLKTNKQVTQLYLLIDKQWIVDSFGQVVLDKGLALQAALDMGYLAYLGLSTRELLDEMFADDNRFNTSTYFSLQGAKIFNHLMQHLSNEELMNKYTAALINGEIEKVQIAEILLLSNQSVKEPDAEKIAIAAGISPQRLNEVFTLVHQRSIQAYFDYNKCKKAKKVLESKKFTLKEIADFTGYGCTEKLKSAFASHFNWSPERFGV